MSDSYDKKHQLDGGQFAASYAACERQLFAFIYSIHPYADDVEDILQETLALLWKKYEDYDTARPFYNWACSFAYHKVQEHRRREARRLRLFREDTIESLKLANERVGAEPGRQEEALNRCLYDLPEEDRKLVEQRYTSGESLKSIAEATGTTANTLYKRLQRIRFLLIECVGKRLALEFD